jgi:catechol 2,3-dioxygenase-like lactoylglutathione lyase family enzyme
VPRLVGINHVAVEVGDIGEALAFWERVLGDLRLRGRMGDRMAFVDMGDQFVALAAMSGGQAPGHVPERHVSGGQAPGHVPERHVGLVVDDRQAVLERARAAGADLRGNDVVDPWGNRWQIVDYRDVQFTKAPRILEGMGLEGLEKSERALAELREKGLAD